MRAIEYKAEPAFNTWSKKGYLFENGIFLSDYQWFNEETYLCKSLGRTTPEVISWGKGVMGSFSDYQFFKRGNIVELDYKALVQKCKKLPWFSASLNGINLSKTHPFDPYHNEQSLEILSISRSIGIQDVQNTDSYLVEQIKYIIVGDNPGVSELAAQRYFVGNSGLELKLHFEKNGLVTEFYKECMIFNKTMLHTSKTGLLYDIKAKMGEEHFNQLLKNMAKSVANAYQHLEVPILVFGLSELQEGKLFYPFWNTLLKELPNQNQLFVFKHPSNKHFLTQWEFIGKANPKLCAIELLFKIGKENMTNYKLV